MKLPEKHLEGQDYQIVVEQNQTLYSNMVTSIQQKVGKIIWNELAHNQKDGRILERAEISDVLRAKLISNLNLACDKADSEGR